MYIKYTPIELFDEPEQQLQYPATKTFGFGLGVGDGGGIVGGSILENGSGGGGGIEVDFFPRKSRGARRRCSEYSTTTVNSSNPSYIDGGSSIPMGLDLVARIRKLLHFADNTGEGLTRKRSADCDWNSTSQFKYRKVESDFPKIITRSFEEDDLSIVPQRLYKTPQVMAQRKQQQQQQHIQKDKKSSFLRPKTVIKQVPNTSFADIEFSDDDDDEIILTNGRGESIKVVRQTSLGRPGVSKATTMTSKAPTKVINIPFKQRQPPPPLIEARTGGILASTLMPDLQPIRHPTYSSILSAYTNGLDNAFTSNMTSKGTKPKERIVPIERTAPILYNGSLMGSSAYKGPRSIIAQEYQSKDRDQYSELLSKMVPNLYGIRGTSPKLPSSVKAMPSLARAKATPTIDLTVNGSSNLKKMLDSATAIDLSDDDVSDIIDLANEELNIISACSKLQKDEAECSYDVKKRAAEKKNQLPYVEPVNSLKEKFDLSPVCKPDWLQNFYSKWEKKRLERKQELAESEKEVQERSAETRSKEKQMHERLRSLQIVDPDLVVIDDFPEGEEEQPEFREITPDLGAIINAALFNGPADQMLISKFNMNITRRDINTLLGKNWLNDEVINFYMNLLTERGDLHHSEGLPKVYAMNTFFVPKLTQSGHSGVRRWTRKVDIFSYDIIPVPVHVGGVHWCMAIIHLRDHTIKYYDSMGTPNPRILSVLEQYLREESLDKRKRPFDTSEFQIESVRDVPRQLNGSDCGVFSCMFAEYITRDQEITFSQQHMEYFRHRMILEIVQGTLMQ